MQNKFDSTEEFKVQVLSRGGFIDNVEGTIFTVSSMTIRLSSKALNDYYDAIVRNDRFCYEKEEDYREHIKKKDGMKEAWKSKILDLLGLPSEGTSIEQIVSEIFGVCYIQETYRKPSAETDMEGTQ